LSLPLGRPFGLPDRPFLKRVDVGGIKATHRAGPVSRAAGPVGDGAKRCNGGSRSGGPGTVVHLVQQLAKRSGFGGAYDSRYNPSSLVDYLRRGAMPTNVSLRGAGSDGTDTGAVPGSWGRIKP
jgi:hypothetical protein